MNLQIPTSIKTILTTALAASAFTAVSATQQPNTIRGLVLGGGILASASALGFQLKSSANKLREEAKSRKLSESFVKIYDNYRGTVQAVELAINADITVKEAETFLASVAAESQGKKIDVGTGVAYTFPHAESTLVELNKRATEWAANQVQALQMENQALRTQVQAAHMAFLQGRQQQTEVPEIILPPTLGQVRPTPEQAPHIAAWEGAQQPASRPRQIQTNQMDNPWGEGLL